MIKSILLSFIPIFVAVDAVGTLPIFVGLTDQMTNRERFTVIIKSLITAACIALVFIFLGKAVFGILNITVADFMVAGGILLFCIAILDLLSPIKKRRIPSHELGFVPLGTPLIAGPALLTTSLLMMDSYGLGATIIAVSVNILLAGLIFLSANFLMRILGVAGSRALSKITSLLLAAIAVMMIRRGITFMLGG